MSRLPSLRRSLAAALLAAVGLSCSDSMPTAPTKVAQVVLAPRAPQLVIGDTIRLHATPVDRNYVGIDGRTAHWSASGNGIVSIDPNGLLHALAAGASLVTAEIDGFTDTTTVTVLPPPVDSVAVAPALDTLIIGRTRQLVATTFDASHNVLQGRDVTWQSLDAGVATVSASGVVTAVSPGQATIRATSEGKTASATIVVIPVPVKQVIVTPNPAQVQQGGTVQLTASTRDSAGGVLAGRAVSWQSLNTAVATVDQTGLVTGVSAGSTTIRATSEGIVTNVPLTVAVPSITLSATTAAFTAKARTGNPPTQAIAITNGGAFTLSGLSVSTSYAGGQPTGWLAATLNTTTAPATLTLAATTGALDPGTYTATVTVSSSQPGVASRQVAVSFVVTPFPIIHLSATSPQFTAQANGVLPGAQTVTVTNVGTGTLSGLTAVTSYGAGAANWLNTSFDVTTAPATLTLQPNTTALAVGTYTATIVVSSSADATVVPDTIHVTYVVGQGPVIGLSRTSITPTRQAFATTTDVQIINITNPGGGTLDGLSASVAYAGGQPTGWITNLALGATTAPTTLTIESSAAALAAGTYNATITVSSTHPGVQSQTIGVTFTVTPQPVISLSATAATFSATRGGGLPTAQGISVTNSGGGFLTGLVATSDQSWLTVSLNSTTAPATLTIQPNTTALAAGTYNATVTVSSSVPGVASRTVAVSYTVFQPQIVLAQTSIALGTVTRGFTSTNGVNVTNGGQGTLSNLQVASDASWLGGSLGSTTAPTLLTATTNTSGLAAGSYTGHLTVSSTLPGVSPVVLTVTVTVLQPQIGLSTTVVGASSRPGVAIGSQTVNVTNTGQGTLNGLSATSNQTWVTPSLSSTTAPATLTLTFNTTSLGVGTYTATITVASTVPGVTSRTITVTVNVDWSFVSDIAPMLGSACAGCHINVGGATADFTKYSDVVNAATATSCTGRTRVVANDTTASFLYQKLAHATPACGSQMPSGGPFWNATQLQKLREWILRGAPNN